MFDQAFHCQLLLGNSSSTTILTQGAIAIDTITVFVILSRYSLLLLVKVVAFWYREITALLLPRQLLLRYPATVHSVHNALPVLPPFMAVVRFVKNG